MAEALDIQDQAGINVDTPEIGSLYRWMFMTDIPKTKTTHQA
jgi:hypothetical protein